MEVDGGGRGNAPQRRETAGAEVVRRMENEMDRLQMETAARDRVGHFAALQRRCLELHLNPQQRRRLSSVPLPRRSTDVVPAATWTKTRQYHQSSRFIAQHVALHNLLEAELRAGRADEEAAELARRCDGIARPPLLCVAGSAPVAAVRSEPAGWRRELASYAASTVPRAMDRPVSQRAAAGAAVSDVLRARARLIGRG